MSSLEIDERLLWRDWIVKLAAALDLEELENYRAYVLAGGDPKKFKWSGPDRAGTRPDATVLDDVAEMFGGMPKPERSRLNDFAKFRGLKTLYRNEDGTYVDEAGQPVSLPPGYRFVEAPPEN